MKESEQKFLAPNFEEDLPEIGGSGNGPVGGNPGSQNVPPTSLTDLSGYNSHSYSQHGSHNHYNGHYNHYNNSWHQSPDYNYYQQGYYGGGGGHYGAPGQPMYHQDQWAGAPAHQGMVLPPGPSPTGSNNSPSPHGFSDTNDDHLPHRTDLKRPSPDSFVPHSSLGPQSLHHQPPVTKKPKVSKRRKKRDPNEPQKPVSAYALFFRDTQASIKLRHPNANFGEVSKIVASTWDSLDPEAKGQYKKKTEMAKKEYLRALAAYRANLVSKGSGHELYGGFPGYGPMLVNGSAMEQAMPATGLVGHAGLGPGNISPGSMGPGSLSPGALGPGGMMGQGIPPHYNGSYHPGYMHQIPQHNHGAPHGNHGPHHQQQQHSPGPDSYSPKLELKEELDVKPENYENGHFRSPTSHYPPHSQGAPLYPNQNPSGQAYPPTSNPEHQYTSNQASGKCGRPGCPNSDFCSNDCVLGECKEVYNNYSSCMVKPGPGGGPNPDVMVK